MRMCPYCMKANSVRQERQIHAREVSIECYCIVCLNTWWTDENGRTVQGPFYSDQTFTHKERTRF